MERYKNKWFSLTLEKDLKKESFGVNIHCKEDGIHMTVPPYPTSGDDFTDTYSKEMLKEDYETTLLVKKIQNFVKDYQINVDLESAVYGDNIKIKLNVENA